MVLDPNDYTVRELRGSDSELDGLSADELEAALELEREGKDRDTAVEQIERALSNAREAEEEQGDVDAALGEAGGDPMEVADELAEEAEEVEDDPLEDLYEDEVEEEAEPEPEATYPADNSSETVIFDPLGTPSNVPTGHDAIHLADGDQPRCGANVGAKGVRRRRNSLPSDIAECNDCRTA